MVGVGVRFRQHFKDPAGAFLYLKVFLVSRSFFCFPTDTFFAVCDDMLNAQSSVQEFIPNIVFLIFFTIDFPI